MTGMEAAAMGIAAMGQAGGQIYSGFAEQRGQAEAARVNREQASWERARAAIEADDYRAKGSRARAADLVRRSASGVDTSTGTPLLTDLEATGEIAYGAETIMRDGMMRSYRLEQEADLRERKGKNALASSFVSAAGTGLTAASALSRYARGSAGSAGGNMTTGGKRSMPVPTYTYPVA